MKITILANRDLASNLALNLLLPELLEKEHRVRVFLSAKVGNLNEVLPELRELQLFEQTLFNEVLFPALEARGSRGELLGFGSLGERIGHEIELLSRPNTRRGRERLRATEPDLMLSIRYGGILRSRAIALPKHGVLNLHSGLLPQYRGVLATFRALLDGQTEIGTTLHTIDDAGIDTGRILGHTRTPVVPERSYLWHVLQLYPAGCRRMLDAVEALRRGEMLEPMPQSEGGTYYSFPTREKLRAFRKAGFSLCDAEDLREVFARYLPAGSSG